MYSALPVSESLHGAGRYRQDSCGEHNCLIQWQCKYSVMAVLIGYTFHNTRVETLKHHLIVYSVY